MRFESPQMLWVMLMVVALLCLFLAWSWQRKQKAIRQFVQSRLLAHLTVGVSHARQILRLVLMVLAVAAVFLGLARPQWGFDWEELHQQGLDILVAIDTSRSMLAEDAKPNRLAAAKRAAFDLVQLAKSDRLGIVAFAGTAFLQCPLTTDETAFRQSIESLDVGIISEGGTALAEAIRTAEESFEKQNDNHKVLVLFTDGEDHDEGALAAAQKAAKNGLKIFTIGVGSGEGELIRVTDPAGKPAFLKDDEGNVVKSRLNETLLQQIASAGNGFYLPLRGTRPIEVLYERGLAPLPKGDSTTKLIQMYREHYHWPLGLAVALLLAEMFLPQRRKVRKSRVRLNRAFHVLLALGIGWTGLSAAQANPARAWKSYEHGDFASALREYESGYLRQTNDGRLAYNSGDAAYKSGQYPKALKYFNEAALSPDPSLQEQSLYNLGNTSFDLGDLESDPQKKMGWWEQSVQQFEHALKLKPQDADARHNLEFVRKKMEELKRQEQQNPQPPNPDKKQDQKQEQNQKQQSPEKENKKDQPNEKPGSQKQDKQEKPKPDPSQEKNASSPSQEQRNDPGDKRPELNPQANNSPPAARAPPKMQKEQMTEVQAKQLLDAQRQEEKALIFRPPDNSRKRVQALKDW